MADNSIITGIEQGRAKFAYECVKKAKEELGQKHSEEYKSYVKKIPAMIKTNGLGAAFAFVKSKGKEGKDNKGDKAYRLIYKQTYDWLIKSESIKQGELVEIIISQDSTNYRLLTKEVLALFSWLKRFADGLIEKD